MTVANTPELRERVVEALRSLRMTPYDILEGEGDWGTLMERLGFTSGDDLEQYAETTAAVQGVLNQIQDELDAGTGGAP